MRGKLKIEFSKSLAMFLLGLLVFASILQFASAAQKDLIVTVMDVGQGDSILIEAPSGKNVLIDGGSSGKNGYITKRIVLPTLRKKGINKLDCVILTHPHEDHVGGLPYVLEKIETDLVLDSGQVHTSPAYYRFLQVIERKNVPYRIARAGQVLDLGEGVIGYILHPSEPMMVGTNSNLDNNSVVLKVVYNKTVFLFTGDLQREGEDKILSSGCNVKSNILKVGHHGSRTSTTDEFLRAVDPEYAVVSVGAKNKYGHPSKSVLERLNGFGVMVFRTDLDGAVIFKSDGERIKIVGQGF